jgi:hypothetical protein
MQAGQYRGVGGWGGDSSRSSLGVVLGGPVDTAAWGIVPCESKIDVLGGGKEVASSGESFHAYTRFIRWDISTVY